MEATEAIMASVALSWPWCPLKMFPGQVASPLQE